MTKREGWNCASVGKRWSPENIFSIQNTPPGPFSSRSCLLISWSLSPTCRLLVLSKDWLRGAILKLCQCQCCRSKRGFRINYDPGLELSKILLILSHLKGEYSYAISAEVVMSAYTVTEARDFSALPMFFCRQFKVLKLNLKGAIYFHRLKFYQIFDSESQPLSLRVSLPKVPLLKQQQMRTSVKDIIKFHIWFLSYAGGVLHLWQHWFSGYAAFTSPSISSDNNYCYLVFYFRRVDRNSKSLASLSIFLIEDISDNSTLLFFMSDYVTHWKKIVIELPYTDASYSIVILGYEESYNIIEIDDLAFVSCDPCKLWYISNWLIHYRRTAH